MGNAGAFQQVVTVSAVLHAAVHHRNPKHVSRGIGRIPSRVHPVLQHICPAEAVEPEAEFDIAEDRAVVAVTQTGHPEGRRFADREFHVTVARGQLLLRRGTGVVTPVTPGGLALSIKASLVNFCWATVRLAPGQEIAASSRTAK